MGCPMLATWTVATMLGTLFLGIPFLRSNDARK